MPYPPHLGKKDKDTSTPSTRNTKSSPSSKDVNWKASMAIQERSKKGSEREKCTSCGKVHKGSGPCKGYDV